MTYYCCIIDIFGCLFKNVKVLFIYFFAENFIFNGQSKKSFHFLLRWSFSSIFWWRMYNLLTRLVALIYKVQKSYFLGFMLKYPALDQENFPGWMNESSTHRPHSLRVFSNLPISVCRFNVHCFFLTTAHSHWIQGHHNFRTKREWNIFLSGQVNLSSLQLI